VIVLGHRLAEELAAVGTRSAHRRAIKVSGRKREVVACSLTCNWSRARSRRVLRRFVAASQLLEPSREPRLPTLRLKAHSIEAVDTLRVQAVNWFGGAVRHACREAECRSRNSTPSRTRVRRCC